MARFSIRDTKLDREFLFEGELIAEVSTERPGRPRWSELKLYKTRQGQFVLVKAGRSLVFHKERSCAGRFAKDTRNSNRRIVEGIPCLKCGPSQNEPRYFAENDLVTVIVSKTAAGVVESAHTADEDGVVALTHMAQRLLVQASEKDEEIREAYAVQVVA